MGATCCWTTSLINNWCCWPCDFKFSGAWKRKAWVEEKMVVGTRNQNETRGWSAPSVWGSRTSKIGGWTNSLGRISCWSWALKIIRIWAGIDETSFRGCKTGLIRRRGKTSRGGAQKKRRTEAKSQRRSCCSTRKIEISNGRKRASQKRRRSTSWGSANLTRTGRKKSCRRKGS